MMSIVKNDRSCEDPLRFRANPSRCGTLFALIGMILGTAGCGPTADDPAAVKRLKAAGMLTMKQNDRVYQIKTLMQPITTETATDIASLRNLKNIDFNQSEFSDDIFATAVKRLNPISVNLSGTAITDEGLGAMSGYGRIEAIFLQNTQIGDAGLKAISGLDSLTEINLKGTRVTSTGLVHLAKLSNLKRLILDKTAVDDTGVESLKTLTSLGRLEVRETGVTPAGVKGLSAAIPGLLIER